MELVDEVFNNLVSAPPSETFFAQLFERFAQPEAWRVFDDVLPALDALASRDVKLGVISNWDERLRGLLERLKLDRYFETITVSCEVGFSKPSPVIFEHASTKLGLSPGAILHIGDSPEMDLEGARAAGFHALRIRRSGSKPADDHLHSLAELPAKIEKLQLDD
jgi:putative hydrolase of the HAD superfamily